MAYPFTTDWPTSVDAAVTRVDNIDTVYDEDFNYPDSQIRAIEVFLGTTGDLIGAGAAGQGPGGLVSPIADGVAAIAFKLVARDSFVTLGGKLLSLGDDYDSAPPAYTQKFGVDGDGVLELNPIPTLPTNFTKGRVAYKSGALEGLYTDDGTAWNAAGGGGGGSDSLPDISHWLIVDVTSGSYTPDGTIQLPFNSVSAAVAAAAALSPTPTNPVGIKIMPGVYVESGLDLPSYVHAVGEDRDACVLISTTSASVIEQTNSHASWRDLTIQRTGSEGTTGGTGDDITPDSPVVDTATLDDAGGAFTADMIGRYITITGATAWQNDGTFLITAVNSATQIEIANSYAVSATGDSFTYTIPDDTRAVQVGVDDWAGTTGFITDVLFEDVVFLPGERRGVIVQGAGSGTGDDITSNTPSFGLATLDDAGGAFTSDMVGKYITITGATTPDHNGSFYISAVNSTTQIVIACGTFSSIVGDSFTYGIESDADFKGCRVSVEYPNVNDYRGSFLTLFSSADVGPRVRLYNCEMSGDTHATTGVLEMQVCNVDDGQVRATNLFDEVGDASIYISRSRLTLVSFQHPGHEYADWGALHLHTTGDVQCHTSSFLAMGEYDGCSSYDSFGVYIASLDSAELPSGLGFMNCHFGYVTDPGSPTSTGDLTIPSYGIATANGAAGEYVSAVFSSCAFPIPVEGTVHNSGETVFPVGPNQLYGSVSQALGLIEDIGTDYLVIKLFEDSSVSVHYNLPSGQWVVIDLNGYTGSGTIVSAQSYTSNDQYVIVKNGKLDGSTLVTVTAGATVDIQAIFEDLEIINGANVQTLAGAAGSKIILRDIRGWVGKSSSWGMRLGSTTFEYELEHVYIKGGGTSEAVQFDNVATSPFSASRCTFIHASGGPNLPLKSAASITQGSAIVTLDFCRMNADPTSDANIAPTAESAFNIIDANLVDFLG